MTFIVRGAIAPHGSNYAMVGQTTYITEHQEGWFSWDGHHKAKHFATLGEAQDALRICEGPWFQIPSPETIEIVDSSDMGPARGFAPTTTMGLGADFDPTQPSELGGADDFQKTKRGDDV